MQARYANATLRLQPDPDQLRSWWRAMVKSGDVHEVRLPKTRRGPHRLYGVASGYFDEEDAFVTALAAIGGEDAEGVYLTLNPVNPALLARASNRLQDGKPVTTTDADITKRRHLLIDIDPDIPTGVSATDTERQIALDRRDAIYDALTEMGWPPPVAILSTGNGGGLVYRVRGENTPEAAQLIGRVLNGIKSAFHGDGVKIDTTVHNAARIAKVAGTISAKGDDLPDRPWRVATADFMVDPIPVPIGFLNAVAGWVPTLDHRGSCREGPEQTDALEDRLHAAGIGCRVVEKAWATVYTLDRCLTSQDHAGDTATAIFRFPSGALAYRCLHQRCAGMGWTDVRERLGYGESRPRLEILPPLTNVTNRTEGTSDQKRSEQIALTYDDPPVVTLHGPLGEYVAMMRPTTEAPDAFLLGGFLTVIGAVMGRRILVSYPRNLYPNLYTVLVGITGRSRKDHAADLAIDVTNLQAAGPHDLIVPSFTTSYDVSSAEGLVKFLKDYPNTIIRISELTHLMDNARRKSTTTILDKLIELWGTPPWTENLNKLSPVRAEKPYLSILAATQPSRLEERMTDAEVHSGFANRWLYIFGRGKEADPEPPHFPVDAAWALYTRIHKAIHAHPEGTVFDLTPAARVLWREWYIATMKSMDEDETEAAIRIRHHPLARKIALIYAVTDGEYDIDRVHLEAAISLLDWSWTHLVRAVKGWGAGDEVKLENRITDVLRSRGPIKKWQVQALCKRGTWPQSLFHKVVGSMIQNEAIVKDKDGCLWLREQIGGQS